MKKRLEYCTFLVILFISTITSPANTKHLPTVQAFQNLASGSPWVSYTNGNTINSIAINGNIVWTGTNGGVLRWDRTTGSYIKYTTSDGLPGNENHLSLDRYGIPWTISSGIVSVLNNAQTPLDKSDDTWIPLNSGSDFTLQGAFTVDQDNRKWFPGFYNYSHVILALDDKGTPYTPDDDQWTIFNPFPQGNAAITTGVDAQNNIWFALSDYSDYQNKLLVLNYNHTLTDTSDDQWATIDPYLLKNKVVKIATDSKGLLWFGIGRYAYLGEFFEIRGLDTHGTPMNPADDSWYYLGDKTNYIPLSISLVSKDRIWITGTVNQTGSGAIIVDPKGTLSDTSDDNTIAFSHADGVSADTVVAIAAGSDGSIWIGGTSKVDGGGAGLSGLNFNNTLEDKSDDSWVYLNDVTKMGDIVEQTEFDTQGNLWFVTDSTYPPAIGALNPGQDKTSQADDQWAIFDPADGGLPPADITSILLDGRGHLWITHKSNYLNTAKVVISVLDYHNTPFDKSDDQWVYFYQSEGFPSPEIRSVSQDAQGRLWFLVGAYYPFVTGQVRVLDDKSTLSDKSDDTWYAFNFPADEGSLIIITGFWTKMAFIGPAQIKGFRYLIPRAL